MIKSGNSITTNLLMKKPVDEKNGVEITIKGITDLVPYYKAVQYIVFFPNIYFNGVLPITVKELNSIKLKRFNNFAAINKPISSKLLLGNVLYPIQSEHFSTEIINFLTRIERTGIVIQFNIGELNITPNRENIIYTSDTISKIEDRILAAKKELHSLIKSKLSKDYDNISEWYKVMTNTVRYNPIEDTLSTDYPVYNECRYTVTASEIGAAITYKGKDLTSYIPILHSIFGLNIPNYKGQIDRNRFTTKHNCLTTIVNYPTKLLILNEGTRLTEMVKAYLRRNYDNYLIMSFISKKDFIEHTKLCSCTFKSGNLKASELESVINDIYQLLIDKAIIFDKNDNAFLNYKNANKSYGIKSKKEIILYVWDTSESKTKQTFGTFDEVISYIKYLKKGIILTNMDSDESLFSKIASLKKYVYIKARKDVVTAITNTHMKCLVDINWLVNKDPMLSIVKTLLKYYPEGVNYRQVRLMNDTIESNLEKEFCRLVRITCGEGYSFEYRKLAQKNSIKYDSYTEYLCLKLKEYVAKYIKAASEVSNSVGFFDSTLTAAVLLKTKAYRINNKTYNKIKDNKLIKLLCKK